MKASQQWLLNNASTTFSVENPTILFHASKRAIACKNRLPKRIKVSDNTICYIGILSKCTDDVSIKLEIVREKVTNNPSEMELEEIPTSFGIYNNDADSIRLSGDHYTYREKALRAVDTTNGMRYYDSLFKLNGMKNDYSNGLFRFILTMSNADSQYIGLVSTPTEIIYSKDQNHHKDTVNQNVKKRKVERSPIKSTSSKRKKTVVRIEKNIPTTTENIENFNMSFFQDIWKETTKEPVIHPFHQCDGDADIVLKTGHLAQNENQPFEESPLFLKYLRDFASPCVNTGILDEIFGNSE